MIINSHLHINPFTSDCFFYNDYTFERLLYEMDINNIDISLPSLNPKLNIVRCPNDCSTNCPYVNGINNNMENCGHCIKSQKHRTAIVDNGSGISIFCTTCKKVLYSGIDPIRKYNIEILEKLQPYSNRIKPFVYLTICNTTIQDEINFYESNFKGRFIGYKLHPWTNQISVENLHVKTNMPFLIHTGIREIESTSNALIFAKNHQSNNIVLAHAAQLNSNFLQQIAEMDNVYIDCCPSTFLFNNQQECLDTQIHLNSPADVYKTALNYLSTKKILFGTDSPWGKSSDELSTIQSLNLSQNQEEDILFRNACNIYSIY